MSFLLKNSTLFNMQGRFDCMLIGVPHAVTVHWQEKPFRDTRIVATGRSESLCRNWESNPGPPGEQSDDLNH